MSSAVIDLQEAITSPDCDIVNVLRKAHVIAAKLKLTEFDKWVQYELNGYGDQAIIPEYRWVSGKLKGFNPYHGWIPAIIPDDEMERAVCEKRIANSISEIVALTQSSDSNVVSEYTGQQIQMFNKMFSMPLPIKYSLFIPKSAVMDIIEKVKNNLLEWTLKLEDAEILGENMRFSSVEKSKAQSVLQTINNYYGSANIVNGSAESIQIVSGEKNNISFSYENVEKTIDEIREIIVSADELSAEDKTTVLEMLDDASEKAKEKKKPEVIRSILSRAKDFLIQIGASIAMTAIQEKIQSLL